MLPMPLDELVAWLRANDHDGAPHVVVFSLVFYMTQAREVIRRIRDECVPDLREAIHVDDQIAKLEALVTETLE
jgi:hypothetical protein